MWRFALAVSLALMVSTAIANAEAIRFGAILPLSGAGERIGVRQMHGIQFAIDRINAIGGVHGNKIEVVFQDSQARPDLSIVSFNDLVDSRHIQVIFTAFDGPTLAMAPLATSRKVLLVNASAQADKLAMASPFLINTIPVTAGEIPPIAKYLTIEGKKRAVILYESDAAGISGRDDFQDAFPLNGANIVAEESVPFGQSDFRSALLKLAEAKPDVILVSITTNLLQLARQYRQLDLKFAVVGTTFFEDADLTEDPSSEGFVHTRPRRPRLPEPGDEFKNRFGTEMEFFARQYYDATLVVLSALDRVLADGQPVTGEMMSDEILKIRANIAAVPIEIVVTHDGKDVAINN